MDKDRTEATKAGDRKKVKQINERIRQIDIDIDVMSSRIRNLKRKR